MVRALVRDVNMPVRGIGVEGTFYGIRPFGTRLGMVSY
jgi:hypothetical protein